MKLEDRKPGLENANSSRHFDSVRMLRSASPPKFEIAASKSIGSIGKDAPDEKDQLRNPQSNTGMHSLAGAYSGMGIGVTPSNDKIGLSTTWAAKNSGY